MRGFSETGLIARANVDVLIQTFNEEINLPLTLASIQGWTNRIFVVDSGSTDRTVEIARDRGATVVHHDWEGYARQKNWALDNLPFQSDWILILDADEAVSPELREELRELVSRPADSVPECGFYLNRIFIFMGRKIRHCGYFPSWNLRLFKRGKARYEERKVHEHMVVDGPTGYLKHLLLHEDCRGLEHFVAKHNRYSTLEAADIYEHPEPWPGLRRFFTDRTTRRRFGKSRILTIKVGELHEDEANFAFDRLRDVDNGVMTRADAQAAVTEAFREMAIERARDAPAEAHADHE